MSQTKKIVKSLTNDILAELVKKDVKESYVTCSYQVETEDTVFELALKIPSNLIATNNLREEVIVWANTWKEHFDNFLADEEYSISPAIDEVCRQVIDLNDSQAPSLEIITTVGYIKSCMVDEPSDVTVLLMLVGNSIATEVYGYINQHISNNDLESLLKDVNSAKKD